MKESDKIVSIAGQKFIEVVLPDLRQSETGSSSPRKYLFPYHPVKQKKVFPAEAELLSHPALASMGISQHKLDWMGLEKQNKILPPPKNDDGFTATHIDVLGDDDFFWETQDVLDAHGWIGRSGLLHVDILAKVIELDGPCIVTKAKLAFGESWRSYIGERASLHLCKPLSRLWYAANLQSLYYAHNDDLRFGYLWAEYKLKMNIESFVNTGRKVIAGSEQAAESTNVKHSALREKRFQLMRQLVSEIGPEKAAIECELQGLGKAQAVKRQWNRFQEKNRDT